MAAADRPTKPLGYSDKQTVRIMTVDKTRNRVECAMRDGAMIYAAVWDAPTLFRWPKPEEIWTVRKDMGIWRLDAQVLSSAAENQIEEISLSDLPEGETRILGDKVHINELITNVPIDVEVDVEIENTTLDILLNADVRYETPSSNVVHRTTWGNHNTSVGFGVLTNRGDTSQVQVNGSSDPTQPAGPGQIPERGSVGFGSFASTKPAIAKAPEGSTTYTSEYIESTAWEGDLNDVEWRMIIDVDGFYAAFVSSKKAVGNKIYVEGWRKEGKAVAPPPNNAKAWVQKDSKAWAGAFDIFQHNDPESNTQSMTGIEIGVFCNIDNAGNAIAADPGPTSVAFDAWAGGGNSPGRPQIGHAARGDWQYGFVSTGMIGTNDFYGGGAHFAASSYHEYTAPTGAAFADENSHANTTLRARRESPTDTFLRAHSALEDVNPMFKVLVNGQIAWGPGGATAPDVHLSRLASEVLYAEEHFVARKTLGAQWGTGTQTAIGAQGPGGEAGIAFGSAADTNLFRSAADTLKTSDKFIAAAGIGVGNAVAASGPVGTIVKKIQVFDSAGNAIGYLPVYESIT